MEPLLHSISFSILANPIYVGPTGYEHPVFAPWSISAMEGLLLGLILWRWTHSKPAVILFGFLINLATLILFWSAIRRKEHIWEYDFQVVAIGEVFVVVIEALAIVFVVRKFSSVFPKRIWWKSFGVSLALNTLSFFAGALVAWSLEPANIGGASNAPASHATVP